MTPELWKKDSENRSRYHDLPETERPAFLEQLRSLRLEQDPEAINTEGCSKRDTDQIQYGEHYRENARPGLV